MASRTPLTFPLDGWVHEIRIYGAFGTAGNKTDAQTYATSKWGIGTRSLPADISETIMAEQPANAQLDAFLSGAPEPEPQQAPPAGTERASRAAEGAARAAGRRAGR